MSMRLAIAPPWYWREPGERSTDAVQPITISTSPVVRSRRVQDRSKSCWKGDSLRSSVKVDSSLTRVSRSASSVARLHSTESSAFITGSLRLIAHRYWIMAACGPSCPGTAALATPRLQACFSRRLACWGPGSKSLRCQWVWAGAVRIPPGRTRQGGVYGYAAICSVELDRARAPGRVTRRTAGRGTIDGDGHRQIGERCARGSPGHGDQAHRIRSGRAAEHYRALGHPTGVQGRRAIL